MSLCAAPANDLGADQPAAAGYRLHSTDCLLPSAPRCESHLNDFLEGTVSEGDEIGRELVKITPLRDRSLLLMQYHGKISDVLSRRVRGICPRINVVFVTRKLKTFMPSLKGKIPDELKSRVIYEITCPRCKACYVGMTSRHLCTRLEEHRKESAPVAQHLKSCEVSDFSAKIIDSCINVVKLATLESLYIEKTKPSINTREEYRQRPLSIKLIQ